MQITRSELDTTKGPADWFTGDACIDTVVPPQSSGDPLHVGEDGSSFLNRRDLR